MSGGHRSNSGAQRLRRDHVQTACLLTICPKACCGFLQRRLKRGKFGCTFVQRMETREGRNSGRRARFLDPVFHAAEHFPGELWQAAKLPRYAGVGVA